MTTDLGPLLLIIAGFLMALSALIAILDRIESSLYDAVATRPDSEDVGLTVSHDDPTALLGLPEPRRKRAANNVLVEPIEPGARHPAG